MNAIDQECHKPIFLLQTVNLYNTVFRQDQARLIQKRTVRSAHTTLILRFVNLIAHYLPQSTSSSLPLFAE